MDKVFKIGIIGTGGISNCHIRGYLANPNAEVYAMCDINPERVKSMAEKYGVPLERTFTDKDEMLKALPELDAVSVCTWNNAHAECSIAALNAGKHVLCEKPMAMNTEQALAMQEAAKKAGKLLMLGFVRRHYAETKVVKEYVDSGFLGDLYYAKCTYLRRNGNPGGWFGDSARSGGGPLIDLGVHIIDLSRYLVGNPQPVAAYGATFQKLYNRPNIIKGSAYTSVDAKADEKCDVEDLATAIIRFDNGAVLNVETSFCLNIKRDRGTVEIFGTKGGAQIEPDIEIYTDINNRLVDISLNDTKSLTFEDSFAVEMDHFIDCIAGKTECIAPAEDGVALMKILDAVYESARTGHEVIIK